VLELKRRDGLNQLPFRLILCSLLLALGLVGALWAGISLHSRRGDWRAQEAAAPTPSVTNDGHAEFLPQLELGAAPAAMPTRESGLDCVRGQFFCVDIDSTAPRKTLCALSAMLPASNSKHFEVRVVIDEARGQE
jgi:hypothetical protein